MMYRCVHCGGLHEDGRRNPCEDRHPLPWSRQGSQGIRPGMRVRVVRDHPVAGRLEGEGVVLRYWRNGAWFVRLEPHGCEMAFDGHEIFERKEE